MKGVVVFLFTWLRMFAEDKMLLLLLMMIIQFKATVHREGIEGEGHIAEDSHDCPHVKHRHKAEV